MKKHLLSAFFLFLSWLSSYAQESCKDIIYTAEEQNIIFDCCIKEVRNGNVVWYVKDGDTLNATATAISKDGKFMELSKFPQQQARHEVPLAEADNQYRGHDYEYYSSLYKGATVRIGVGAFFTLIGVGLEVSGIVMSNKLGATNLDKDKAAKLIIAGAVFESLGIPLWISGGIRRANNQRAMEEIKRQQSITFGATPSGIGLSYNF